MSQPHECQVRVCWSKSAQAFQAVSMTFYNRQQASSTSSAQRAAAVVAAKILGHDLSEVVFVGPSRPGGGNINAVGTDWVCFNFALRGSASQMELPNAGGAE